MTPVFITRPAHQAATLTQAVAMRGFTPVSAPCLELRIQQGSPLELDNLAAFAVTSANGVLALAARTGARDLPLFAVGTATASEARAQGFTRVEVAEGDGAALARMIGQRAPMRAKSILCVSGAESAFDLVRALNSYQVPAESRELYSMPVAAHLPQAAIAMLDRNEASFALLMSPRTATAFGDLVAAAGRTDTLGGVTALCMSPAIGKAAAAYAFRRIAISEHMTQDSLLDLLETESGRV
jgi:uroporphyrinogen-III synthase